MMANMGKRGTDIDPMAEIEKAAALYEQYIELSGIASIHTVTDAPSFSAPGPMTNTFI